MRLVSYVFHYPFSMVLKVGIEKLNRLFNPKRIAVIGASDREGSIGGKILRNLIGVFR